MAGWSTTTKRGPPFPPSVPPYLAISSARASPNPSSSLPPSLPSLPPSLLPSLPTSPFPSKRRATCAISSASALPNPTASGRAVETLSSVRGGREGEREGGWGFGGGEIEALSLACENYFYGIRHPLSIQPLFSALSSSPTPSDPSLPTLPPSLPPSLLTPPSTGVRKRGHVFGAKKKGAQITPK